MIVVQCQKGCLDVHQMYTCLEKSVSNEKANTVVALGRSGENLTELIIFEKEERPLERDASLIILLMDSSSLGKGIVFLS